MTSRLNITRSPSQPNLNLTSSQSRILSKKNVSFQITQKWKETTLIFRVPEKKRLYWITGYFDKWKRKREQKDISTISAVM